MNNVFNIINSCTAAGLESGKKILKQGKLAGKNALDFSKKTINQGTDTYNNLTPFQKKALIIGGLALTSVALLTYSALNPSIFFNKTPVEPSEPTKPLDNVPPSNQTSIVPLKKVTIESIPNALEEDTISTEECSAVLDKVIFSVLSIDAPIETDNIPPLTLSITHPNGTVSGPLTGAELENRISKNHCAALINKVISSVHSSDPNIETNVLSFLGLPTSQPKNATVSIPSTKEEYDPFAFNNIKKEMGLLINKVESFFSLLQEKRKVGLGPQFKENKLFFSNCPQGLYAKSGRVVQKTSFDIQLESETALPSLGMMEKLIPFKNPNNYFCVDVSTELNQKLGNSLSIRVEEFTN